MVQNLLDLNSFLRVFAQQLLNEVLTIVRNSLPYWVVKRDFLLNGLMSYLLVILAVEWQMTTQHQINYDSK